MKRDLIGWLIFAALGACLGAVILAMLQGAS